MLGWSWGTWPDVLVDFGRELYIPWQITEGKALYRDIAYLNGPLSPHLNALWFALFGVSLRTLVLCNIVIAAATVAMLYQLLAEVGGRLGAVVACLVFELLFACSQFESLGNFNFITPYSHEMTHGCALSVAALWSLMRYLRTDRAAWLGAAGGALGLVFLTKIEFFLAVAPALMAALGLTWWRQWRQANDGAIRRTSGAALIFAGAAMVPAVAACWFLTMQMPFAEALSGTLGSWMHARNPHVWQSKFHRMMMGTLEPGVSVGRMLMMTGWYASILIAAGLWAWAGRRWSVVYAALSALSVLVAGGLWLAPHVQVWVELGRPLPLLMLVLATVWAAALGSARDDAVAWRRVVLRLALTLFALVLLLKIILNVRLRFYGFALAAPATMLAVVALLEWAPLAIRRLGGDAAVFRAAALAVIGVVVGAQLIVVGGRFAGKPYVVGDGADAFRAGRRGQIVQEALQRIDAHLGPGQTLAVLPEGVMLNYLLRRPNPTRFISFTPPEFVMFDEACMVASYRDHPPDVIVMVARDWSEYRVEPFGVGYGVELEAWVRRHYRPAAQVGHGTLPMWLMVPRSPRVESSQPGQS